MPVTTLLALLALSHATGPYEAAVAKIAGAEGLSATFLDRSLSGAKALWTLKLQKPNKVLAETANQSIIADGSLITFVDKSDHRSSQIPETDNAFERLVERPEFFLARLFFQSDASWVSKTTQIADKSRDGAVLTGFQVTPGLEQTASIYVSSGDGGVALVQVDVGSGNSQTTHLLDKIQISVGKVSDSAFQSSLSSEGVSAGTGLAPQAPSEEARRDEANGYIPYKQLSWDDFPVTGTSSAYQANTEAFIHYNFRCSFRQSGSGYLAIASHVEIRSGLDKSQTWRLGQLTVDPDKLLRHEQGHLDINEARARRLRKMAVGEWPKGEGENSGAAQTDLAAKVKAIVDAALAESNDEQKQYDDDTQHGRIEESQAAWLSKIKKELDVASKLP